MLGMGKPKVSHAGRGLLAAAAVLLLLVGALLPGILPATRNPVKAAARSVAPEFDPASFQQVELAHTPAGRGLRALAPAAEQVAPPERAAEAGAMAAPATTSPPPAGELDAAWATLETLITSTVDWWAAHGPDPEGVSAGWHAGSDSCASPPHSPPLS